MLLQDRNDLFFRMALALRLGPEAMYCTGRDGLISHKH